MPRCIYVTPSDDLQSVIDHAPSDSVIHLGAGIYRQKVMIRSPGLTLIGAGQDQTKLIWDDHANKPHPVGGEFNTFRTYTLAVCADRVTIRELSVINDARSPEIKGQEVALSVVGTDFRMDHCSLSSTQDTLFLGPLPSDLIGRYEGAFADELRRGHRMQQYFEDCHIEGTVDFIFGCGEATFHHCRIHSLTDARNTGYVAAPSHEKKQNTGFLFRNCELTCDEGITPGSIYLARPWRDHGIVRFENCIYGPHIAVAGFDKWNNTDRDQTARFYESPAQPGRVSWINRTEIPGD